MRKKKPSNKGVTTKSVLYWVSSSLAYLGLRILKMLNMRRKKNGPLNLDLMLWWSISILSDGRRRIESAMHFNLGIVVKMLIFRILGLNNQLPVGGQEWLYFLLTTLSCLDTSEKNRNTQGCLEWTLKIRRPFHESFPWWNIVSNNPCLNPRWWIWSSWLKIGKHLWTLARGTAERQWAGLIPSWYVQRGKRCKWN